LQSKCGPIPPGLSNFSTSLPIGQILDLRHPRTSYLQLRSPPSLTKSRSTYTTESRERKDSGEDKFWFREQF
jgi:hypothetical protein